MGSAMSVHVNLLRKLLSTAGHATAPFVSYEIIGALGVAGAMAHHLAGQAFKKAKEARKNNV